ncbi:MAG: DHH family phosphoesterase [Elusimicrobia bacterium]|nr:DHH family phosphoesterase [Elusimicrobiota bacterium]
MKTSFHAHRLLNLLARHGKKLAPLTILTHDHPDPDALASAWALAHLAHGLSKVRARIVYGGIIGRAENRLMAERLLIPANPLRKGELREAAHVALVDTQPPFRNNRFSPRGRPDLIIDHHPRHPDTQADLALIDESAGATSTILGEALLRSGLKVPRKLATAIVYGIGSETQNLGREAGPRDMAVYQAFWPKANMRVLWKISYPRRSSNFFGDLARGIRHAFTVKNVIGVNLGALRTPDRVAQIADFLLTHEKSSWSIVTGRYQARLHVSLRTSDAGGEAGRLLKRLLGGGNRGGGHGMIAGGSVEVGSGAPEIKWRQAEEKIIKAFLQSQGVKDPGQRAYPFRDGSF